MKIIKYILASIILGTISMSCNEANRISSEAKERVNNYFKELAKDPSSVTISNVSTVFCDDSLCILHLDFKAKNGLGIESMSRMEYIYIFFLITLNMKAVKN